MTSGVFDERSRSRAKCAASSASSDSPAREHDDRRDDLAPLLVGETDDRDVGDGVVLAQHFLDLGRCDVLAAADDRVVGAALDEQVAVGVESTHDRASRTSPAASTAASRFRYSPDTCSPRT